MLKRSLTYACIICIVYIIVVGYLGIAVRDDFFVLTYPSWPFLINCTENCGHKSSLVVNMVALLQGLLTVILLIAGLGFGFSVPEPIPVLLVLAVLSGAALAGLIARQWWALIPASLLIIGLGFFVLLVIGVGAPWMPDIEWYVISFFGLFILVPIATIAVSMMATGATKPQETFWRVR